MSDWKVLQHGELEPLAENLWRVEGAVPGMSLRRVMAVARRSDGGLVVHSAIAMDEARMKALEALGELAYLLVPNGYHRLDGVRYKRRYPQLRVLAPRGSRDKIAEVVPVDGTYDDFPADPAVELHTLVGTGGREGAMWVRSKDGASLVLCDVVMNMDRRPDLIGRCITTMLGSAPGPRISRLAKLTLVKDRPGLKAELGRYADDPGLVRLLVAHDKIAHGPDAAAALHEAMGYL